GNGGDRFALLSVEIELLDPRGFFLVPVPTHGSVVEVRSARAHPADVECEQRLQRVARGFDAVRDDDVDGRRDVESLAWLERERVARTFGREVDREPTVRNLERGADVLRTQRSEIDRNVHAVSADEQLQGLAQPGGAVSGVRDVVLLSVE